MPERTPSYNVRSSSGNYVVQFRANPSHCSNMIAHIIVGGTEWGRQTLGQGSVMAATSVQLAPGTPQDRCARHPVSRVAATPSTP